MPLRGAAPSILAPSRSSSIPGLSEIAAAILVALVGFGLATQLFFPGIVTHDALAVYDQAYAGSFGDWQPPLMGVIWTSLERVFGFGPRAIFLPVNAVYWGALLLIFFGLRRFGAVSAWLVLVVGFLPPTFALIGIVWRDVIFSALWLSSVGLMLVAGDRGRGLRIAATLLAFAIFIVAFWIRPNALFAAAPLFVYLIWPNDWRWKRLLLTAIPVVAALQFSSSLVNYTWLQAREDHALHSIFVFDLDGITHFSGQNAFPVDDWTPEEFAALKTTCYDPTYWDAIWWEKCTFAMARLNRDDPPGTKLFGSDRLRSAWLQAILAHPVAYAEHRLLHFWTLMAWHDMVLFEPAKSGQWRFLFIKDRAYRLFESAIDWLHDYTPLFRGLPWLILSLLIGIAGLRFTDGRAKSAVMALSISGFVYTMTYLPFGVAAEYRYVYWTTLSSLVGAVIVAAKWELDRRARRIAEGYPS